MAQKKVSRPSPNPPPGFGGLRAYAAWRKGRGLDGGSHPAVNKAITSGRISPPAAATGWLDFARADDEWARNTKDQHLGDRPAETAEPLDLEALTEAAATRLAGGAIPDRKTSEAMFTWYRALREQTELHQLRGRLVEIETVRREQFTLWRSIRDSILSIPARLREPLAAAANGDIAEAILREELMRALESPSLPAAAEQAEAA